MNGRLEILAKIDKLHDSNCVGCPKNNTSKTNTYCTTVCNVGKELQKLGNQLLKPKQDKRKALLKKGQNLTFADVDWLLLQEVPKRVIAKSANMGMNRFNAVVMRRKREWTGFLK